MTPPSLTENTNVNAFERLITPRQLKAEYPLTPAAEATVLAARSAIRAILRGDDERLLVIAGPCSIHDEAAALEYAGRLADLRQRHRDRLEIVMRVYVEKPRTTVGWRGYLIDPHLNGQFDLNEGLRRTRSLMRQVNELGLPVATELLDPFVPQYLFDLLGWVCIGARTVESQTHRVMASAVSAPVGFKNGTGGGLKIAVDAAVAARAEHAFFTITEDGEVCVVHTSGNDAGHVVLRGGRHGPNYDPGSVAEVTALMQAAGLPPAVVVDCSHANSGSDYTRQGAVWRDVLAQIEEAEQLTVGRPSLRGLMIESHLYAGKQAIPADLGALRYGVSVTDGCVGWTETEELISLAAETR